MSTLLAIGLANAACAAVLAIPAFLASRYSRRPALAHALWLLVLLKLVTPPVVRPSLPWLPAEEAQAAIESAASPEATSHWVELQAPLDPAIAPFAPTERTPADLAAAPVLPNNQAAAPVANDSPAFAVEPNATEAVVAFDDADPQGLLPFLGLVWLLGMVVCFGRALHYGLRFQRLLVHARLAPQELQEQAREMARKLGMKSCPDVWLVPGSLPPMVWSVGAARILFPAGLLARLDSGERASLLAHELGHIARRDHWVRWLELVVLGLYWWYPLAWWARRQLQQREEECCDARVAATVPPRIYASAILEAVDFLAEPPRSHIPSLASPLAGARSLKQRLLLIMSGDTPGRLTGPMRIALLVGWIGVLPLLPTLARQEQPPAQQEKPPVAALALAPEHEPTEFDANAVKLIGGSDAVFSVAFSPDGKRVATGTGNTSRPGEVEVYDVATRKLFWRVREPRGVSSVFFSPDGNRLGWAGFGGMARVADLTTLKNVFSLSLESNNRLAYSPDGQWLATASEASSLRLWEAKTGRPVDVFRGDLVNFYSVGFSHNSKLLAAGGGLFNGGPTNHALIFDVLSRKQVAKLTGHTRAVINVAFAPRDAFIATSSADSTVRVWDASNYKLLHTLTGHTNVVKGLAFSPDGKTLATGSWDKTIRLWDFKTGKQLSQLDGHPAAVREIAFSPDGNLLVSGGGQRSVKLWDVKTGKQIATLRQGPAPADPADPPAVSPIVFALSPDGKRVAAGSESGSILMLDAATGEVERTLKGHEDAVTTLAFSRDGKTLASAGPDTLIKLWSPTTGKELRTLKGHESWIFALAFSHDGKTLASGSYDKSVRLWPLDKPGAPRVLKGHRASVRSLSFSPNDLLLASGSTDKMVRVWDVQTFAGKTVLKGHDGAVRGVGFSPDGQTLASVGEDGFLYLWDPVALKERTRVKRHQTEALCLAFSPAGRTLATGAQGGSICFWDPHTAVMRAKRFAHNQGVLDIAFGPGAREIISLGGDRTLTRRRAVVSPVRYFDGHKGPVVVAVPSPDGKYVLSCGGWPNGDKTLRLWELATGKEVRTFIGNNGDNLQSAAFSPDGKYALAGGTNGTIWQWEVQTGKLERELKGHTKTATHLTFSPDAKRLLSSSNDKTLRLWNFATGKTERTFTGHTDWARRAVFLPDGKRIVSGGRDRVLRLWDVETAKLLKTIEHNKEWVESIAVTADGKRVLTGGANDMRLWDLETGKVLRTFTGHRFGVTGVALLGNDRTALSCSYDGSSRLWDVASGVEIQRYGSHRNWVWSVAPTADGKHFLSCGGGGSQEGAYVAGEDFTIRLWKI